MLSLIFEHTTQNIRQIGWKYKGIANDPSKSEEERYLARVKENKAFSLAQQIDARKKAGKSIIAPFPEL